MASRTPAEAGREPGGGRARGSAAHLLKNALSQAVRSVNLTMMPSSKILVCFHESVPYLKYPPLYPTAASRAPPRAGGVSARRPARALRRTPGVRGGQTLLADEHDRQQQQAARGAPAGPPHRTA